MPTFDYTCEVCGAEGREWRKEKPPRFCSRRCLSLGMAGVARGRVGEHSFSVPYCEFVPALKKPLEPMFGRGRTFDTKSRSGPQAPPQWQQDDE